MKLLVIWFFRVLNFTQGKRRTALKKSRVPPAVRATCVLIGTRTTNLVPSLQHKYYLLSCRLTI